MPSSRYVEHLPDRIHRIVEPWAASQPDAVAVEDAGGTLSYPIEVEQAINVHPQAVQSAVVGRTVDANEEVVAFVEPAAGSGLTAEALTAHLRDCLSPCKLPAEIVFMEHLPASATGKILKSALKDLAAQRVSHGR
jgi:acyl-coenzyme A synthetase/AMP-(fatty) acid ligase